MPGGGDEPPLTLKRPRLVWTPQLYKRFVDAVVHLGIKNAVPKTNGGDELFMQIMPPPLLHHHQNLAALAQQQLYQQRSMGHFGFDNGFQRRMGGSVLIMGYPSLSRAPPSSYGEDIDSGSGGGRRVLSLFPPSSED